MKFIKIDDQLININAIHSVYPSRSYDVIHINCGNTCAIFSFQHITLGYVIELLKEAEVEIIE